MRILFLGEGDLSGPARYLAAILRYAKLPFDHRPDQSKIPKTWRRQPYSAIILSDYRLASFTPCAREWLAEEVLQGTGLLMIGGWASFTGSVGHYADSMIERLLPVRCHPGDDRMNRPGGALLRPASEDSLIRNIDWQHPPMVCGYHRAHPKPGSRVLLEFRDLQLKKKGPVLEASHPALVVGQAGRGRTAAFLTDCAPHWAGGLVDWGNRRVRVALAKDNVVEVGDQYLRFFERLIRWVWGSFRRVDLTAQAKFCKLSEVVGFWNLILISLSGY